jgi:hypothetical protein
MGRIIGIVLFVVAIYFAANYVTGGASDSPEEARAVRSAPQRAGDKVREAFQEGTELRERIMPEE